MTAPDPRLGEIEDRLEAAKYHSAPAFMIPTADVAYLLAELRSAREALARVEGLCIEWEVKYGPGSKADAILGPQKVSIKHAVTTFRAAVAAADGGAQ